MLWKSNCVARWDRAKSLTENLNVSKMHWCKFPSQMWKLFTSLYHARRTLQGITKKLRTCVYWLASPQSATVWSQRKTDPANLTGHGKLVAHFPWMISLRTSLLARALLKSGQAFVVLAFNWNRQWFHLTLITGRANYVGACHNFKPWFRFPFSDTHSIIIHIRRTRPLLQLYQMSCGWSSSLRPSVFVFDAADRYHSTPRRNDSVKVLNAMGLFRTSTPMLAETLAVGVKECYTLLQYKNNIRIVSVK